MATTFVRAVRFRRSSKAEGWELAAVDDLPEKLLPTGIIGVRIAAELGNSGLRGIERAGINRRL